MLNIRKTCHRFCLTEVFYVSTKCIGSDFSVFFERRHNHSRLWLRNGSTKVIHWYQKQVRWYLKQVSADPLYPITTPFLYLCSFYKTGNAGLSHPPKNYEQLLGTSNQDSVANLCRFQAQSKFSLVFSLDYSATKEALNQL